MNISKPGLYNISEAAYHADPCIEPSLSCGVGKIVLGQSPRHAWIAHPKLNPKFKKKTKKEFDVGKAAHTYMLRDQENLVIVDAADWRTKAAQEERDRAYAEDKIPLLPHQIEEIKLAVLHGKEQLKLHEVGDVFAGGKPEMTLIWREGNIWCRIRLDYYKEGSNIFYDYKTTNVSAKPDAFKNQFYNLSYDFQAAFYARGIKAVLGIDNMEFRFVVQEMESPYALSVIGVPPAATAMADRKVEEVISIWTRCLNEDRWPGYPSRVCYLDTPAYAEKNWLDYEERQIMAQDMGEDPHKLMMDWQSPLEDVK